MRFSIITVCWNSEKMLPKSMASLASQSFRDYEWVVVDGGSTDETLNIVNSFDAAPVNLLSEPDKGIYDAMNKGVKMAKGEILFFLNSDDSLHDERVLEDVSNWFASQPDTAFLFGDVVNIKRDGLWLRDFEHVTKRNIIEEGICHQAIFASRLLFDKVGEFDRSFKLNADYDWIIRVFRSNVQCAYMKRRMAFFRDGGASSIDREYLAIERSDVRLQYVGKCELTLRIFRARILNRLNWLIHDHALGVLRLDEKQQ